MESFTAKLLPLSDNNSLEHAKIINLSIFTFLSRPLIWFYWQICYWIMTSRHINIMVFVLTAKLPNPYFLNLLKATE